MNVTGVGVVVPPTIAYAVTVLRQFAHCGDSDKPSSGLFATGLEVESAGSNLTAKAGSVSVEGNGNAMAFTVIVIVPALGEVPETVGVVETSSFVVVLSA